MPTKEQIDLRVVDNHVIESETGRLVLLRDLSESVQEETVTELHDVSFVNTGNFLK